MSETINPTVGLSFNLDAIHGYVTGITYDHGYLNGASGAFARAALHDADEESRYEMAHIKLGAKINDTNFGSIYAVESWEWISEAEFDLLVGMREIRESLGWIAA